MSGLAQVLGESNVILLALMAEFGDIVQPFVHEFDTGDHVKKGAGPVGPMDTIRTVAETDRLLAKLEEADWGFCGILRKRSLEMQVCTQDLDHMFEWGQPQADGLRRSPTVLVMPKSYVNIVRAQLDLGLCPSRPLRRAACHLWQHQQHCEARSRLLCGRAC